MIILNGKCEEDYEMESNGKKRVHPYQLTQLSTDDLFLKIKGTTKRKLPSLSVNNEQKKPKQIKSKLQYASHRFNFF